MKKMRGLQIQVFALLLVASATAVRAQTYTVLYNLGNATGDPVNPAISGIIAQGRDGNLYSAALGGTGGFGAGFKITSQGKADGVAQRRQRRATLDLERFDFGDGWGVLGYE